MSPEATTQVPPVAEAETPSPAAPAPDAGPAVAGEAAAGMAKGLDLPDISTANPSVARGDPERNIGLIRDVILKVKVELGRGRMFLRDVLRLTDGSVVELEKLAGDPLDIYVNDRLVGKGEVLVLNENFCVRITQIFSPEECLRIKGIS
jgi:flagellar motor switch protein FliN